MEDAVDGLHDFQPDFFTFNFAGQSGKFYIKKNGQIIVSPHQNIKIEPLLMEEITIVRPFMDIVPQYTQWRITTENGTQYEFKDLEKTTRHSYNPDDAGNVDMPIPGQSMGSVSAWFLTKIKSPGGSEINLTYTDYGLKYDMPGSEQYFFWYNSNENINLMIPRKIEQKSNTRFNTRNKRLKKITFRTGEVEFIATGRRCDLVGDSMLNMIVVRDKSGNTVRRFELNYLYMTPGGMMPVTGVTCSNVSNLLTYEANTSNRMYRLMLDKVTETDAAGSLTGKEYRLEYNTSIYNLPARNSRSTDHWGYHNGVVQESNEYPYLTLGGDLSIEDNYFIIGRDPSLEHTLVGVLKKITYPTGGSSSFEYELNDAYVGYGLLPPVTVSNNYGLAIHYDIYSTLGYNYYIKDGNKIYYKEFTIANQSGMQLKIDIKGFASQPISPIGMRFDIENTATNSRVVTMNEIDMGGQKTVNTSLGTVDYYYIKQLPPGTYRITFQPDEYFIDNTIYQNTYQQVPQFALRGWLVLEESGQVGHITRAIGGLRLKRMTDADSAANNKIVRSYVYKDPVTSQSSGSIINAARYVYKYAEKLAIDESGPGQAPVWSTPTVKYMVIGTEPNYPLYSTQGSNVGYSHVQVLEQDAVGNGKGITEYVYTSPKEYLDIFGNVGTNLPNIPYPPADSRDWLRGQLISQTDFLNNGSSLTPIRKVEQIYSTPVILDSVNALAVHVTERLVVYEQGAGPQITGRSFKYARYHFTNGYRLLASTKETTYSTAGNIESVKNYEYSAAPRHLYPTAVISNVSKGTWQVTEMKYPQDYLSLTATDNLTKGIKNLQNMFVVNSPVETTRYITDEAGGNKKMTGSQFVSYHPTLPFPSEIAAMEVTVPVSGFIPSFVSSGAVIKNVAYKPRVLFTNYGEFGTLREQRKANDVPETIIWGYDYSYPVARILGSSYSAAMSNVTIPSNLQQHANESLMLAELNKIHNGLAGGNSQVTTYTFKPLVGPLSEQLPTRLMNRYEYDGLGRLKLIRDHAGKITKLFDYQFQSAVQ